MFLERIQVKGFKSIREMDLELRPLNVLIGANGSGKSNFIEVFRLLRAIVDERLQNYVAYQSGADRLLYRGKQLADKISLKLLLEESAEYEIALQSTNQNTLVILDEYWKQGNFNIRWAGTIETNLYRFLHTPLEHEFDDEFEQRYRESQKQTLKVLRQLQVYHFHDTTDRSALKKTVNIHDNDFLRSDGSNLAAFLYLLQVKYSSHYDKIIETIQWVAPFFKNFILRPNPHNENTIRLQWQSTYTDEYWDVSVFPDGLLRFIALTTVFRQPNPPPLIIIDEPELGLHPVAINLLSTMLESASTDSQIIIATQSTNLVDYTDPENLIIVELYEGASTFRRLPPDSLDHWLERYSLGQIWEKDIFGGRP